jgi:hypothetical protein
MGQNVDSENALEGSTEHRLMLLDCSHEIHTCIPGLEAIERGRLPSNLYIRYYYESPTVGVFMVAFGTVMLC